METCSGSRLKSETETVNLIMPVADVDATLREEYLMSLSLKVALNGLTEKTSP